MSEILDDIKAFMDRLPRGPVPARMETGLGVLEVLRAAAPAEERPAWIPPLSAVVGLPIVPCDDMQPGEWRLIDTDGNVIGEGTL